MMDVLCYVLEGRGPLIHECWVMSNLITEAPDQWHQHTSVTLQNEGKKKNQIFLDERLNHDLIVQWNTLTCVFESIEWSKKMIDSCRRFHTRRLQVASLCQRTKSSKLLMSWQVSNHTLDPESWSTPAWRRLNIGCNSRLLVSMD